MQRYGISLDQLSAPTQAAARAAERQGARTIIFRGQTPVASILPIAEVDAVDPPDPGQGGEDPLLALCGVCSSDAFVEGLQRELAGGEGAEGAS